MGRLIDADKLRDKLQAEIDKVNPPFDGVLGSIRCGVRLARNMVEDEVTVDAEPVRHGHWEEENTRTHSMQFKCSVCGRIAYYPQNHHSTEPKRCGYAYCPNCGSRMDGREDDAVE